jgi:hypothetical protein
MPSEPLSPPAQELLPWVAYGFGVSWEDVGDLFRDRLLPLLRVTPELARWSGPLLEGEPGPALQRLVEALSDEIDAGRVALDLGSSAGESFSRRRGNRLLIAAAALLDASWEVDLVLARPLELAGTHLAVPTTDAFFMPLLRVARSGEVWWLDIDRQRRGIDHINPVLQGSDALVLPLDDHRAQVEYLEELPVFPNPELEERMALRARIDALGNARLEVSMRLVGARGEQILDRVSSVPQERIAMVYRQLAVSLFPACEEVEGEIGREGGAVVLGLGLELPGACDVADEVMTCRPLVVATPLAPLLASLAERRYPLVLQLPVEQQTSLEIDPPPGWEARWSERRFETRWGSVVEEISERDGWLHSVLELSIPAQVVEPEDYGEFARFCHAIDELVSRPPVLRRTAPP